MSKKPYKYWSRNDLFWKLREQAVDVSYCDADVLYTIKSACYDNRWNPSEEFNGCNVVQDDLHPFLPCFLHDWRWITNQNTLLADQEFKKNLLIFGYFNFKASLYYYGVRLGWLLWYKWKK